jgi:antirestriction protein
LPASSGAWVKRLEGEHETPPRGKTGAEQMPADNSNDAAEFQVYFADLRAYNSGRLVGGWVSPRDFEDAAALNAAVLALLEAPDAEWAAHDSQGIKIGEYESLENIMSIARACEDWGCDKVQAAIDHGIASDLEQLGDAIADHDGGEFSSPTDWANEYISSCYDLDKMLGSLASYFDYEAFARDAELGGDISFVQLSNGNVWVINHH